jgi:hypothetical protein
VKKQTSTLGVLGDLGQYPINLEMQIKTIKYWIRVVNLPNEHIVKQMYNSQMQLHNLGHRTWITDVKNLLEKAELSHLWEIEKPEVNLSKHIKKHMELLYRNLWTSEVNNSTVNPKLRLYKLTKETFEPELYLYINVPKYRYALSKLRLSSNHLEIETGRHSRPITPPERRFCASIL